MEISHGIIQLAIWVQCRRELSNCNLVHQFLSHISLSRKRQKSSLVLRFAWISMAIHLTGGVVITSAGTWKPEHEPNYLNLNMDPLSFK